VSVGRGCQHCDVREVFLGSEALEQGKLTEYELRRWHRAIFRDVSSAKAISRRCATGSRERGCVPGGEAVIAGVAASALHGAQWVDYDIPIELIWSNTRSPRGLVARDETLGDDGVTRALGLPVTTPARTAYDLGRHLPRGQALARMDALMRATPYSSEDVLLLTKRYAGARGIRRLRAALLLVDGGAASPKETWLRLLLIDAGFPVPTTQIPVVDGYHDIAILDMGWEAFGVAAEYDGDQHRSDRCRYVRDQRRLRKLAELGWIIIRVIAEDTNDDIVIRVRDALLARGWRP
jgi:hypothetical protein